MNLFRQETPFPSKVLSVNDLTRHLKSLVESDRLLSSVWVEGEISNLVKASSGHCYFTLKDDGAVIKAALWAGNRRKIKDDFKNGDKVMVYGGLSVYPPRGDYQIVVSDLRQSGIGALYAAYEKLKKKLEAEGLFDPERKLPFPLIPKGIGIVTSPHGAVIQDIYRVVRRRFENMPMFLFPARVQGDGAASEIVKGIERLVNDERVDVIIVARGGGSLEDLWPFNEEIVARAISSSIKPVISAVGHETDTTIADMVADRRAATPSVAGELAVPVKADLQANISRQLSRLNNSARMVLALARERYNRAVACRFLRNPALLVSEKRVKIMNLSRELDSLFRHFIDKSRHRFSVINARLKGLNPLTILQRGFVVAVDENGNVLSNCSGLSLDRTLILQFADGKVEVKVVKLHTGEN